MNPSQRVIVQPGRSSRTMCHVAILSLLLGAGAARGQAIAPEAAAASDDAMSSEAADRISPPAERELEADLVDVSGAIVDDGPGDLAVDRFEASVLYRQFIQNEDYEQALDAAEIQLTLSEQEFGAVDPAIVPALVDMGDVLLSLDRPAEALTHYSRGAEIIRASRGIYNIELFDPLMGIGRAQQEMGQHDQAIISFQRAQHITHRNEGVYALGQVEAIEQMAASLMAEERWEDAENLQLAVYKIYRGRFGSESTGALPAYYKLAQWYHSVQDYRQARLVYKRAIRVIEEQDGVDDLALVEPLRGIAGTFISEYEIEYDRGLDVHKRIVSIVENHPDADIGDRVLAHLELGDWYVQYNREQDAWAEYRKAWEWAQQDDSEERNWQSFFSKPRLIYAGRPLTVDLMGWGRVGDEVYYDFEFTVARNGHPDDISILGSNLHGQTRSAALHSLRSARFRPAIVDGATVESPGYRMRRIYPTLPPEDYGVVGFGSNSAIGGPTR